MGKVFKEPAACFQAHGDIAALLDVTMPVMSGKEARGHSLAARPDLPVIVTSVYTEAEAPRGFTGLRVAAGVPRKPFSVETPADAVANVLGSARLARAG